MFLEFNEKPHFVWFSAPDARLDPLGPRDSKSLREGDSKSCKLCVRERERER